MAHALHRSVDQLLGSERVRARDASVVERAAATHVEHVNPVTNSECADRAIVNLPPGDVDHADAEKRVQVTV